MARELARRKADNIVATGADYVVLANPGCEFQIAAELRRRGSKIKVIHLADFLAMASQVTAPRNQIVLRVHESRTRTSRCSPPTTSSTSHQRARALHSVRREHPKSLRPARSMRTPIGARFATCTSTRAESRRSAASSSIRRRRFSARASRSMAASTPRRIDQFRALLRSRVRSILETGTRCEKPRRDFSDRCRSRSRSRRISSLCRHRCARRSGCMLRRGRSRQDLRRADLHRGR